jgi:hypothetical protein
MSKTSGMWGGRILVICVLVFTTSGCAWTRDEHCPGGNPKKPETIRTPDLYGVIPAEPAPWYGATLPERTKLRVGGRTLDFDDGTDFINSLCDRTEPCGVFIGLRPDGKTIDWALSARAAGRSEFEVNGDPWRVDDDEIMLSEGVRLELAPTFRIHGCAPRDRSNDAEDLEGADFGAVMRIEMKSGLVRSAACNGCD